MSRRTHTVRSIISARRGSTRAIGGGEILCSLTRGGSWTSESGLDGVWDTSVTVVSIPVTVESNYRRCCVTATIQGVHVDPTPPPEDVSYIPVILAADESEFAVGATRFGCGVTVSGTVDLSAGTTDLNLLLGQPASAARWSNAYTVWWGLARMEAILCQSVDTAGCTTVGIVGDG
jgi:hypothetical protein